MGVDGDPLRSVRAAALRRLDGAVHVTLPNRGAWDAEAMRPYDLSPQAERIEPYTAGVAITSGEDSPRLPGCGDEA